MRILAGCLMLAILACAVAHAELPASLDQFKQQITDKASDPKASAKLWMDAVYVYLGGNKELGETLITEICKDKDWKGTMSYFVSAMTERPYIFYSYAKGATPDNLYKMDPNNYELEFEGEPRLKPYADVEEGKVVELFIRSGGADLPRPMFFERNKAGLYKVREFSSMCVGIRPPKPPLDESIAESKDPNWVMKRFFEGILLCTDGKMEEGGKLIDSLSVHKDFGDQHIFIDFLKTRPWMFGGYMKGTTYENGYKFDRAKWELNYAQPIKLVGPGEETRAVFKHTGADIPKPIYLRVDERGEYRIRDYGNVYSSCRPPKKAEVLDESVPESTDPVWTLRRWITGTVTYHSGDKEAGLALMNSVMRDKTNEKFGDFHGAMDKNKAYIWYSYVKGTKQAEGYKVPDLKNIEIETYFQPGEAPTETSKSIRIFIRSSGADTARPLRMVRDSRGQWRVSEFSSECVGVKAPPDPNEGNF